jgi:hypothetical protein
MPYNVPLLIKVRDQILDDPDHHNQGMWFSIVSTEPPGGLDDGDTYFCRVDMTSAEDKVHCGTSMCVAGWATHFAGLKPVIHPGAVTVYADGVYLAEAFDVSPDGKDTEDAETVAQAAQRLLGLSHDERSDLFAGTNERERVLYLLDKYISLGEQGE